MTRPRRLSPTVCAFHLGFGLVLDQGGDTLYFIALFPFALKDSINLTVGSGSFSGAAASISSGGDGFTWSTSPGLTWAVGAELAVSLNLNVTTPDAPTSFAATAGPGKVDLAWANPSDFTITKYQYRQSADGGSNWSPDWTDISGSGVSTTTSEVTGLTAGTAYTFQVRAVNAAGSGAVSEAAPVTPDAAAPLAPPRLIAGGQDGIALLFWGAADDNGSPITGYQYRQKEGAGDFGAWTDIIDSAPGGENALSFTVTGLTNGTVYTFEVRAANNVGPGAETGERNAVPQSVPLAPTGFSATRGDGSAILRWTAAFNNGSPITKYQYQQDGAWTDIPSSAPGGGNENSYTVTSLTNGTTYTFKLRAVSNLGNGAEPGQASATPAPAQSTETTLWSATLTVGKHSVLANEWYGFGKNPDDTTYGKIAPDSFTLDDTTYSVVSLISTQSTIDTLFFRVSNPVSFRNVMTLTVGGTTFRGSVVSTTSHRNSGMTWTADPGLTWAVGDTVAVSLKALPPNAPGSFSATAGPLRAELAWTDPDDANITKYQYRQKEGNGDFGNWTNITGSGATTTSHTVAGLTAGIAYTFQVRAVNAAGPGAVSETVPVTPLAAAPLAPPGFRATSGDGSAILYWGAADDNGSPITKYQYQQDGGAWTDIPDSDANTVEYTVTGLTNGAVYAFKLLAVNSIGAGAETDAVTATPLPPPGAPSGLTATANRLEVWPESHLPGFA